MTSHQQRQMTKSVAPSRGSRRTGSSRGQSTRGKTSRQAQASGERAAGTACSRGKRAFSLWPCHPVRAAQRCTGTSPGAQDTPLPRCLWTIPRRPPWVLSQQTRARKGRGARHSESADPGRLGPPGGGARVKTPTSGCACLAGGLDG